MKIHLIAIGSKMPQWVEEGYNHYQKRIPAPHTLTLKALPAEKRTPKSNLHPIMQKESAKLFSSCPKNSLIIAFDRQGTAINTEKLSETLSDCQQSAQNLSLLIGGPEGITDTALQKAHTTWSLSAMTLPHPLVRVIVAEQLFRAFSILANHPYHR